MAALRDRLDAPVLVGVGAAFDFHAGLIPQAPDLDAVARAWSGSSASPRAAPPLEALPDYNPRFVVGFARQYASAIAAPPPLACRPMDRCRRHRPWPGRTSAGARLRRHRPDASSASTATRRVSSACATAACRSRSRARSRSSTASPPPELSERAADAAAADAHRDHARHAVDVAHRDRPAPDPLRCSTTCCRTCARATRCTCARRSRRRRPTSSRATWPSTAASTSTRRSSSPRAERIASAKFFEEISTLPCIVGGVGERSGEVAAELFERLGAPIVQTTPVQAELAKIWTNILRYTTFSLPNLMMMDCEQYDANVFEVIDLINRDYPRGGIEAAGLHGRHVPAQGLRVPARSAPTRRGCCWRSRA